ncbi:MAG: hypothetical protein A3D87_00500 [Omnitrophica WOR_2 bacterium RIFCSPHIGHO2_02_FULL_50_17]|nr:MAG: hypothetical protein A3D87_00500 [Omnitrophica WOR_2 bacterium RIFCSPHIGHO2_02_FULL_50_17]
MIQANTQAESSSAVAAPRQLKAVGLISGGLDSLLAACIVKDLGVEVYGVYFAMPWGCCNKTKAIEVSMKLGIKFITFQLDERYLEMIKNPRYGRGTALNPCVDCRIHMFSRAGEYMRHIGADFVFTGEVLGQRPMSQLRRSMSQIEEGAGLRGLLLRPLCARLFEPTIPEQEGWIDRQKLLRIAGRSRKEQIHLADQFQISGYNQPGGGCLLTDSHFSRRMQDTLDHGYRNFRETVALQWGRHFRINRDFKVVLGRDAEENESLIRYAHRDDYVMQLVEGNGPTVILKGNNPPGEILQTAAGLIQRFSKFRNEPPRDIRYWRHGQKKDVCHLRARILEEAEIEKILI